MASRPKKTLSPELAAREAALVEQRIIVEEVELKVRLIKARAELRQLKEAALAKANS